MFASTAGKNHHIVCLVHWFKYRHYSLFDPHTDSIDKFHLTLLVPFFSHQEIPSTNTTMEPSNTDSNFSISSTTTSSSNRSEFFDRNRISPYVDFSDYFKNVETAQSNGTLPTTIQFN